MLTLMSAAYVVFCAYTPITFVSNANLDDALFIAHAQLLSQGHWLGPFSQFTLMKGPGYSAFLAAAAWSGLPVSAAEAIFNCIAVGVLAWVIWRLSGSPVTAIAVFVVTLWNPGLISLRVLRQAIYSGQTLLFVAAFAYALFGASRPGRVALWSMLAGLVLGWFWLTREEGVWVLPGIAILVLGATLRGWMRSRSIRAPALASGSAMLAFVLVLVAFRSANLFAYGSFVGVDTQEFNFRGAVDTLQSVEAGELIPFVPLSAEARRQIYPVSPAFASLRKYLDPPGGSAFERPGCQLYPWTCGEIAGGWFIWALRDAASSAGYYQSPARAATFFHQLRFEVATACEERRLVCKALPLPFMPRITTEQAWKIPVSARKVLFNLLFRVPPLLNQGPSSGPAREMWEYQRFLNWPIRMPIASKLSEPRPAPVQLALRLRAFLNRAYGYLMPAIFWPGLLVMPLAIWLKGLRRAASDPIIILALAAWVLLFTRILLIALIDASSFPAASWEYAAPAFPLSDLAPLFSIASVMMHLIAKRAARLACAPMIR